MEVRINAEAESLDASAEHQFFVHAKLRLANGGVVGGECELGGNLIVDRGVLAIRGESDWSGTAGGFKGAGSCINEGMMIVGGTGDIFTTFTNRGTMRGDSAAGIAPTGLLANEAAVDFRAGSRLPDAPGPAPHSVHDVVRRARRGGVGRDGALIESVEVEVLHSMVRVPDDQAPVGPL